LLRFGIGLLLGLCLFGLVFLGAQADARVDVMALAPISRPGLFDRRAGGPQVAAEMGLGGFRVLAILAPRSEGVIERVDLDLLIGAKHALLANESANGRREVAHLCDRFIGGLEPCEVVLVIAGEPLQAVERPVEDAGKLGAKVRL
jgi:hypothetical protein